MATVDLSQLVHVDQVLRTEAKCADCPWRQRSHHPNNRSTGLDPEVIAVHGEFHAAHRPGHRVTIKTVSERAVTMPT